MTDDVVELGFEFYKNIAVVTAEITLIVEFIKWFRKREKERLKYIKKPMYDRVMYKLKSSIKKMYFRGGGVNDGKEV
jgi:N-dimethylarginine dimethylaminohydrolase